MKKKRNAIYSRLKSNNFIFFLSFSLSLRDKFILSSLFPPTVEPHPTFSTHFSHRSSHARPPLTSPGPPAAGETSIFGQESSKQRWSSLHSSHPKAPFSFPHFISLLVLTLLFSFQVATLTGEATETSFLASFGSHCCPLLPCSKAELKSP